MSREEKIKIIQSKYKRLSPHLNERTRRCWAATEAEAFGWGGVTIVCQATGIDAATVRTGRREINQEIAAAPLHRIRRQGGGRKKLAEKDPGLLQAIDALIKPHAAGSPVSPVLRWTCESTTNIAGALTRAGHPAAQRTVCDLLHEQKYSLQAHRKTREGKPHHPDRDQQFHFIAKSVEEMQTKNQPVVSVDAKKKENVGNYKNNGKEWRPYGNPREVNMHDFPDEKLGKAAPYGVYDLSRNEGWVAIGISHDTASFAVASIRRWWKRMGKKRYPEAAELLITADCGGSNGNRNKLWKVELQKLADELKMVLHVRHFPPGTSKWNKIEHRLFSFISQNWRGKPLLTLATVVNLIAHTRTKAGLTVKAVVDKNHYKTGIKVSDAEMASLNIIGESFHPEWNYRIVPRGG